MGNSFNHKGGWVSCMDCVEGMSKMDAEQIDLIFADPPFGIGESFYDGLSNMYRRDKSKVTKGYVEVEKFKYDSFTFNWIEQAFRMLKPGGALWVVSGWTNSWMVHRAIRDLKLELVNKVIWNYNFGVWTTRKFVSAHFEMFYAVKPPRKNATFNRLIQNTKEDYHDRQSVWRINREYQPGKQKNATKLPVVLVEKVISHLTNPGDLVLDPFLGNGTTAVAAVRLCRPVIGFELNPKAYEAMKATLGVV